MTSVRESPRGRHLNFLRSMPNTDAQGFNASFMAARLTSLYRGRAEICHLWPAGDGLYIANPLKFLNVVPPHVGGKSTALVYKAWTLNKRHCPGLGLRVY
jgi:hypothetical protein